MIVDRTIEHQGTIGTDNLHRFSFDENAIAHLMTVLTDLYGDPALAVIREYSTNAWDSHVEAGHRDPIEILLPNENYRMFTVRDHGVGLSVEQLHEQFSKYGFSSKQGTNEQVGQLGLGCKSGLAYTSQFTMVARQGGVQATVLVTREGDGGAALQVVDTSSTEEPNGVEITIPVDDVWTFNSKARDFYRYWDPGTVTIDGAPVDSIWEEGNHLLALDPDIVLVKSDRYNPRDFVVMGGVPYPVPQGFTVCPRGPSRDVGVVARVSIGDVNFAPSREALNLTEKTKDTLHTLKSFVGANLRPTLDRIIADAPDHKKAYELSNQLRDSTGYAPGYWRGHAIPQGHSMAFRGKVANLRVVPSSWERDHATREGGLRLNTVLEQTALFVVGFTSNSLSASLKAKARQYCEDHNITQGMIRFISHDGLSSPWCDDARRVHVDDIKEIKLRNVVKAPKAQKVHPYRTLERRMDFLRHHEELPDNVVAWAAASERDDYLQYQPLLADDDAVAIVSKNQMAKFKREHPDVPHLKVWFRKHLNHEIRKITPALAYQLLARRGDINNAFRAPAWLTAAVAKSEVLDPELVEITKVFDDAANVSGNDHSKIARLSALDGTDRVDNTLHIRAHALRRRLQTITKRYPLLSEARYVHGGAAAPWVEYLNNQYIVRQQLHLHPITY